MKYELVLKVIKSESYELTAERIVELYEVIAKSEKENAHLKECVTRFEKLLVKSLESTDTLLKRVK